MFDDDPVGEAIRANEMIIHETATRSVLATPSSPSDLPRGPARELVRRSAVGVPEFTGKLSTIPD